MLILKHSYGDSVEVEPVEEVLYSLLARDVDSVPLAKFDQTLGHSFDHMRVSLQNLLKLVVESERRFFAEVERGRYVLETKRKTKTIYAHLFKCSVVGSVFSNPSSSTKLSSYHDETNFDDGISNKAGGNREISCNDT